MKESALLEAVRNTNLNIERAMFVKLDNRWNFKTLGNSSARLYFVTAGGGFLHTDDQYIEMTAGNVYFLPPGCRFSCGCEYMEKVFFHINLSTVEKYDLHFGTEKIYSMPYPIEKIEEMKSLLKSETYIDILKLKNIVTETVVAFCESFSVGQGTVKVYSPLVQSIISYVEENLSIKLTVSDIARELFISESKIRNTFKDEMNIPLGRYVDDMVFTKAKKMLSTHSLSVAAVSAELGFCDQFYFSRRFKEKFNRTPSKFKSESR